VSRRRDEFGEELSHTDAAWSRATEADVGAVALDEPLRLQVLVAGGVLEFDLPPDGTPLAVGRSPRAHVHIDSSSVSRSHALIVPGRGSAYVKDLGSTNGTYVNGTRVQGGPVAVRAGDMIRFGDVPAHVRPAPARSRAPRRLSGPELDARIVEEAERCIRSDRTLLVLAIEIVGRDPDLEGWAIVAGCLRSIDLMCDRGDARIDAVVLDIEAGDGEALATRIVDALRARQLGARIGVASYPGDAPSPDALIVAANLALRGIAGTGAATARAGARQLVVGHREVVVAEPVMVRLYGMVERLASSRVTTLVTGETGSGKEIVAEALHALGSRAPRRLVKLNCAAVPEHLLENELFGHDRGAFSGATEAKPGLFEDAHGGTMFLDEIGEMTPALQAKLLRVLEDGRVRRLGSNRDRQVDVRVVAATHRDLRQLCDDGRFRSDLYYRLKGVVLHVPPLRDRPREIPLLADRFAAEAGDEVQRPMTLSRAALAALTRYRWPGNIRELRHAISAAAIACDGDVIEVDDLPREIAGEVGHEPARRSRPGRAPTEATIDVVVPDRTERVVLPLAAELESIQRERIREALVACDGNQTRAAELLQMPRRTLVHKIAQLAIDVPARLGRPRKT
jgi:two-component system, NtrC family, response regulator AtoC